MSQQVNKTTLINKLRNAGFPEEDIPAMVGIAGGESSFMPLQHNPDRSTGDDSYGLFQINMIDEPGYLLGEERRRQLGLKSNEELYDVDTNIRAAKAIYDNSGLGAWSAYKNQSYKDYLPTAADLEEASMPQASTSQPQSKEQSKNVLNVYFDKGSQHQDKKDKSKSLLETFKNQILMDGFRRLLNPFEF